MEQRIILLASVISLIVVISVQIFAKKRRLKREATEFILEQIDKRRYSLRQSVLSGNLFYVSVKDIYYELEKMPEALGDGSMESDVSKRMLKEMNWYFPLLRFKKHEMC